MLRLTSLETAVLKWFLADSRASVRKRQIDFDAVFVLERRFTGVGFFASMIGCDELHVANGAQSFVWDKVGAILNEQINTGYLIYIENGFVVTIEGHTFGDDWPEQIHSFRMVDVSEIMTRYDPKETNV